MSWPLGKISDIGEVISGFAFKSEWFGGGEAKIVRIGDLQDRRVDINSAVSFDEGLHPVRDQYRIKAGDILMALSGATVGKVSVADRASEGAFLNQRVAIIRGKKPENSQYLKYMFTGVFLQKLLLKAGGAAQPNLSPKDLTSMEIPLPPLKEQKRIAAILDKADAIRRKRQQAIALADEFLRSAFLELFGDPITNPKGWCTNPLSIGVDSIYSGWSAKGISRPCSDNEVGVLKISAVTSGTFRPSQNKAVRKVDIPNNKSLIFPSKGDLLFSRANTRDLVAATCIVPEDRKDVFLPDKLWLINLNQHLLRHEYLHYLIGNHRFKTVLTSQATGSSGSMLNISKSKFEAVEAIYPPIKIQDKFSHIYWAVQGLISRFETGKVEVDDLISSLQKEALSRG